MRQQYDVTAVLDQFDIYHRYIESHRDEWLEEFPNNWVGVYCEQLVGRGETLESALEEARPKCAVGDAAVEFITSEPRNLLL